MKVKLFITTIVSLLLGITAIRAQSHPLRILHGTVCNKAGLALDNAIVLLADSTAGGSNEYAATAETDSLGRFRVETRLPVNRLIVNRLGYTPVLIPVTPGKDRYDVILADNAGMTLDEVKVRGYKQAVKMKANGLEYDMKYSPLQEGDTWDALRFVPNLKVNEVTAGIVGMKQTAFYVNGRKVKLEGEALNAYIRSFPVERIQRVEVITSPDGRFKEDVTTGIIHLITKQNENEGLKGNASVKTWKTHYTKGVGNMMLTYNRGRVSTDFFASGEINSTWNTTQQVTDYLASQERTTGKDTYDSRNNYLNMQAQMNYQLTDNSSISGQLSFRYGNSDTDQYGTTRFFRPELPEAEIANDIQQQRTSKRVLANLEYRNDFGRQGTQLQVTADYYYGDVQATLKSRMDSLRNGTTYAPHDYYNEYMPQKAHVWSGIARYTSPLSSKTSLTASVGGNYTTIDNNDRYQNYQNGNFAEDPLRSNFLKMGEWDAKASLLLAIRPSKRWAANIGVTAQYKQYHSEQVHTGETYKKRYWQPNPFLGVAYQGDNHSVSYNGSYYNTNPSFGQMNPFRWYSSVTNYRVGNPNLSQEKRMFHRLDYRFFQKFAVGVYYNYADDIIESYNYVKEGGMIEQRPENMTRSQDVTLTLNVNDLSYCKGKGSLSFGGNLWREWYHAKLPQGGAVNHVNDGFYLYLNHFAKLSDRHRLQLINNLSYYSKSTTAFNESPASFNIYAELQKMQKAWTFAIYGFANGFMYDGIQMDMKWRKTYSNDQLKIHTVSDGEGYGFGIRINYTFGNSKVQNLRKNQSTTAGVRSRLE